MKKFIRAPTFPKGWELAVYIGCCFSVELAEIVSRYRPVSLP